MCWSVLPLAPNDVCLLLQHTEIVEAMFTMFFNVLKQEEKSPLLPVVLECLTR